MSLGGKLANKIHNVLENLIPLAQLEEKLYLSLSRLVPILMREKQALNLHREGTPTGYQ